MQVARPIAFVLTCIACIGSAHAEKAACPSQDFSKFLVAFTNDVAIQKNFTQFPLPVARVVDDGQSPEPRVVVKNLATSEVPFPLIPSAAEQLKQDLHSRTEVNGDQATVYYSEPDTDYQFRLQFAKDTCWKLTRKDDDSL